MTTRLPGGLSRRSFLAIVTGAVASTGASGQILAGLENEVQEKPAEVEVSAEEFLNAPDRWVQRVVADQWLTITDGSEHVDDLLTCRALLQVAKLSIPSADFGGNQNMEPLVELLGGSQVNSLRLSSNEIDDHDLLTLVESPFMKQLVELDLYWNDIDTPGIERLVSLRNCSLREVNISANDYGVQGAKLLSHWPVLKQLTELNVGYSEIGDEGTAAFARSPQVSHLARLDLSGSGMGTKGAQALIKSRAIGNDTTIYLDNFIAKFNFLSKKYRILIPRPHRRQLYERFGEQLVLDYHLGTELEQSLMRLSNVITSMVGKETFDTSDTPEPNEPGVVIFYSDDD